MHLQEKAKEKERRREEEKVCGIFLLLCLISLKILLLSCLVKDCQCACLEMSF